MGTTVNQTPRREVKYCPEELPPLYALKFDGVNDYIQTTGYTEFDRAQAFTFQFFGGYTAPGAGAAHALLDNRDSVFKGILVAVETNGKVDIILQGVSTLNRIFVRSTNTSAGFSHFAISYDGSSTAAGVSLYLDGASIAASTITDTLSTSILNSGTTLRIAQKLPAASGNTNFPGWIEEVGYVDYVKTAGEIATDYAAGTQSIGTGAWLLDPVRPIYDEAITTLDPSDTFTDENAVRTYSISGKPNPMDLAVDFEKIQ